MGTAADVSHAAGSVVHTFGLQVALLILFETQPQAREEELAEMLAGAQASLEAMQKLHTAAQNQLFELQSKSEEADAGAKV